MVLVAVTRLGIDRDTNTPVVVLSEASGERSLAIWIGASEANAIALGLRRLRTERPLTHDLLGTMLEVLGGVVTGIAVTGLVENHYVAEIRLVDSVGAKHLVDARPSDAIAVAVAADVPIACAESLLSRDGTVAGREPEPLTDEALRQHLSRLGPEDFGRFVQ